MSSIAAQDTLWHYDGADAERHYPGLDWDMYGFTLDIGGRRSGPYSWTDLTQRRSVASEWIYGLKSNPGWRLIFSEPPPEIFKRHASRPGRYGRWVDKLGFIPALCVFSLMSSGVVYGALRSPQWIAPYIPQSVEDQLGDAIATDISRDLCETKESKAALTKLVRSLDSDIELRQISIARVLWANAITLPGRRIIIFHGLIREAVSADELAGVVGHELGHVHNHDTMAALVRQFGLTVVFGGFNGQVAGSINGLLGMSYSRDAERAADRYSVGALKHANVSPEATADFFDSLVQLEASESGISSLNGWTASHPEAQTRKAMFAAATEKGHAYKSALTGAEWDALNTACGDVP